MLLGRKTFTPKLFDEFSWEEMVPEDHLLRRVAAGVDFSFVRRLTARFDSHTGQPGGAPVVLFKLALHGWLDGSTSERRLASAARLHRAFRWCLGSDLDEIPPDQSVLSKARVRFGVTVDQAFFTEMVRQCERAGLIRGDQLFLDSTRVAANARLEALGARALVAQVTGVDDQLRAVWRANLPEPATEPEDEIVTPVSPGTEPDGPPGPQARRPTAPPNAPLGPLKARQVSRTDPAAALVSRDKVPPGLSDQVPVGVAGGAGRLITAREVTSGEVGDEQLLGRRLRDHVGTTGRTVTEVVAETQDGTQAHSRARRPAAPGQHPALPGRRHPTRQRAGRLHC